MGNIIGGEGLEGKFRTFFAHVTFEYHVEILDRGCMCLEFKGEPVIQVGDINLEVVSKELLFKALRLSSLNY